MSMEKKELLTPSDVFRLIKDGRLTCTEMGVYTYVRMMSYPVSKTQAGRMLSNSYLLSELLGHSQKEIKKALARLKKMGIFIAQKLTRSLFEFYVIKWSQNADKRGDFERNTSNIPSFLFSKNSPSLVESSTLKKDLQVIEKTNKFIENENAKNRYLQNQKLFQNGLEEKIDRKPTKKQHELKILPKNTNEKRACSKREPADLSKYRLMTWEQFWTAIDDNPILVKDPVKQEKLRKFCALYQPKDLLPNLVESMNCRAPIRWPISFMASNIELSEDKIAVSSRLVFQKIEGRKIVQDKKISSPIESEKEQEINQGKENLSLIELEGESIGKEKQSSEEKAVDFEKSAEMLRKLRMKMEERRRAEVNLNGLKSTEAVEKNEAQEAREIVERTARKDLLHSASFNASRRSSTWSRDVVSREPRRSNFFAQLEGLLSRKASEAMVGFSSAELPKKDS